MILEQIITIILRLAIIVMVCYVIPAIVNFIRTKISGLKIEKAVSIILDAVDQTNQTFADALRASGDFDVEAQKEALQMSLDNALSMMNDNLKAFLQNEFNDIEAWITSKIESACKANNVAGTA